MKNDTTFFNENLTKGGEGGHTTSMWYCKYSRNYMEIYLKKKKCQKIRSGSIKLIFSLFFNSFCHFLYVRFSTYKYTLHITILHLQMHIHVYIHIHFYVDKIYHALKIFIGSLTTVACFFECIIF